MNANHKEMPCFSQQPVFPGFVRQGKSHGPFGLGSSDFLSDFALRTSGLRAWLCLRGQASRSDGRFEILLEPT